MLHSKVEGLVFELFHEEPNFDKMTILLNILQRKFGDIAICKSFTSKIIFYEQKILYSPLSKCREV